MDTFKVTLRDGTEYTLADGSFGSKFSIICTDRADFESVWDKMTQENLSEVTVTANDSIVVAMSNLILDGTQAVINPTNGVITGHFYFHGAEYSSEEYEYIEAARILLGEE